MINSPMRIHYFDNLKTAIILLIVIFHCAMSYMKYAPEWWYVLDSQGALPFTWFVIWADNFIMPIMFFISGYFGIKSLRGWSGRVFWLKKLRRIGLPWLIGMVFFVPYMIWLWFYSRDIPITLYDLIFKQYFGPFYQQSAYWYLSSLLALYLLLFCLARACPRFVEKRQEPPARVPGLLLPLYLCATAIPMFALNLHYPDTIWINVGYLLVVQITRVPVYIASFFLGAYCERENLADLIGKHKSVFFNPIVLLAIFAVASALFVWFRMSCRIEAGFEIFINALAHCSFCALSLLTALCVFKQYFNRTNAFLSQLAAMSYAIYFVHQNVVQSIVLLARPMRLHIYAQYAFSLAISLALCYLICRFILVFLSWWQGIKSQF